MSRKYSNDEFIDGFDDDIDSVVPFSDTITSYGADFPVDTIVRKIENQDIYVPDFQRKYIWSGEEASRFIESLLLGLPVPGVFLAKDNDGRHMIIDGQQRLLSIYYFVTGHKIGSTSSFKLKGIGGLFNGMTFGNLPAEYRYRFLDSIIHATIIRQDNPNFENASIFHLFERLNTGGKQLEPQEIRNCMYYGSFRDLLSKANGDAAWRKVYGEPSLRYKDQELILRFIALYLSGDQYQPPIKSFLNKFMGMNRNLENEEIDHAINVFLKAIYFLDKAIGDQLFKPATNFNAAVFDSVTIGVAKRLERGEISDIDGLRNAYCKLLENHEYQMAYQKSTSSPRSINSRIGMAIEFFMEVQ